MSAELAPVLVETPPIGPAVDLAEWADRMTHAGSIARAIAPTPFVPRSLRVYMRAEGSSRDEIDVGATTATVAAAVLTGTELGLSPMAALRSIDIIEGTPALRAVALRALVMQAGHSMWIIDTTSTRAIVSGIRAGTKHEQQSVWTIERAKAAGLTSKPNWQRHPAAMLVARATGEVARWIAPDVLLGLPYTAEELADGEAGFDEPEPPVSPDRKRTAQRRSRPAPVPLPDLPPADLPPTGIDELDQPQTGADPTPPKGDPARDEDPTPAEPIPESGMRADSDQIRAVRRTLAAHGMATTRSQLAHIASVIGRPVELLADLFAAEARAVLDDIAERDRLIDEPDQPALDDGEGP